MRPRLLDPLGFSKQAWCIETPEGTSWGGSGVICTLRDMAKVALLCMNGGQWKGDRLISEEYVRAATSKQIDNSIQFGRTGYGYQIWRHERNGFAFRGMGSQLAMAFPDQDFLFTCISDTQGQGPTGVGIEDALFEEIVDSLSPDQLPGDRDGRTALAGRIDGLRILPQAGAHTSPWAHRVDGVTYDLEPNPMEISELRLVFEESGGRLEYRNPRGPKTLHFGMGTTVPGEFPETAYFGRRIGTASGKPYRCLVSAAWVEEHKLDMLVYITDDYLGTLKISLAFKGEEVGVFMTKVAEWFLDEYQGFAGGRRRD
jgi:hypothetical protein